MLLQRFQENEIFSPLRELQRIQSQLNRMLAATPGSLEFPPVNVWASEQGAIVRAEIPGMDPDSLDISLVNDTLTIRGARTLQQLSEEASCHRQERGCGQFTRSLQLPFTVEAEQVKAKFTDGVLEIRLPRAEADKPRKITVVAE